MAYYRISVPLNQEALAVVDILAEALSAEPIQLEASTSSLDDVMLKAAKGGLSIQIVEKIDNDEVILQVLWDRLEDFDRDVRRQIIYEAYRRVHPDEIRPLNVAGGSAKDYLAYKQNNGGTDIKSAISEIMSAIGASGADIGNVRAQVMVRGPHGIQIIDPIDIGSSDLTLEEQSSHLMLKESLDA